MLKENIDHYPAVTIGLVTFDRIGMLKEAVYSVLNQSFGDFLLLIGNDSPEAPVTFDVLGIDPDPRIQIINHEKNLGQLANLNHLLNASSSKWFTWMGDDDLLHPDFLQRLVQCAQDHSERNIAALYTNYISGPLPPSEFPLIPNEDAFACISPTSTFLNDYTAKKYHIIGSFGLMKTDALKSVHGLPQLGRGFSPYCDTLMPILLADHGGIAWIDEPLVFLRTHAVSESVNSTDFDAYASAESDFLDSLHKVCARQSDPCEQECVRNMVWWFAFDEWCVLARNTSLSRMGVINAFLSCQFTVNFQRLKPRYWVSFLFYIHRLVLKRRLHSLHLSLIAFKKKIVGLLSVS